MIYNKSTIIYVKLRCKRKSRKNGFQNRLRIKNLGLTRGMVIINMWVKPPAPWNYHLLIKGSNPE
jgi:hypothetical protein